MPNLNKENGQAQSDLALDLILKYIKSNDLHSGDRLPSEREMAEMFSVGRPAVREAIKVLSMMDILDVHKQGGTYVSKQNRNSRFDYFRFYLQSGQISISEIFETRLILEVECIALAAKNITDEQLKTIEDCVSQMNVEDAEGFADADRRVHDTIYAATGNRAMQLLMRTVQMWTTVSQNFTNSFVEVRQIVKNDNLTIYEALRDRDEAKCREAMRQHILHVNQIHYISDTLIREEIMKLIEK